MPVFDIHTHIPGESPYESVLCIETDSGLAVPGGLYSAGIHPWSLNPDTFPDRLAVLKELMKSDSVVALGECGLDPLRGPSLEFQREAFVSQALAAQESGKPMILHVVRQFDSLLSIGRQLHPSVKWLVHGFRGGVQQMQQLLDNGLYLSFGPGARPQTLSAVPPYSLILETDGKCAIAEVQTMAALARGCTVQEIRETSARAAAGFLGLRPERGNPF